MLKNMTRNKLLDSLMLDAPMSTVGNMRNSLVEQFAYMQSTSHILNSKLTFPEFSNHVDFFFQLFALRCCALKMNYIIIWKVTEKIGSTLLNILYENNENNQYVK
jgi:hypothetical protein